MSKNILIAAGGTGGHLFPALAVGKELEEKYGCKLYFIGTNYRIESKKIPEMGYPYFPTPITAFPGINFKSINWIFNFLKSKSIANKAIKENNIDALICAGAYLCVPPGMAASSNNVPIFLMESNVNLGKANKILLSRAKKIFTSWEKTTAYIADKSKVMLAGNPIRKEILNLPKREDSLKKYGFENKLTLLIMGGSLGAKSINTAIYNSIDKLSKEDINIIWQTGGEKNLEGLSINSESGDLNFGENVRVIDFINDMASVYSIADLIVSRSGATAVSEISIVGTASILIPLGSASNNEQYLNAKTLADNNSGVLISDNELEIKLYDAISELISNETKRAELSSNIKFFAKREAASTVADFIIKSI